MREMPTFLTTIFVWMLPVGAPVLLGWSMLCDLITVTLLELDVVGVLECIYFFVRWSPPPGSSSTPPSGATTTSAGRPRLELLRRLQLLRYHCGPRRRGAANVRWPRPLRGVAGIWVIQTQANQVPYHGPYQEPVT